MRRIACQRNFGEEMCHPDGLVEGDTSSRAVFGCSHRCEGSSNQLARRCSLLTSERQQSYYQRPTFSAKANYSRSSDITNADSNHLYAAIFPIRNRFRCHFFLHIDSYIKKHSDLRSWILADSSRIICAIV